MVIKSVPSLKVIYKSQEVSFKDIGIILFHQKKKLDYMVMEMFSHRYLSAVCRVLLTMV